MRPSKQRSANSALLRYLGLRLALLIPTVLILVTVVFFFMRVIGDPITAAQGGRLSASELEARREAAGYNRPIWVQYFEYLGNILRGDFGIASKDHREITEVVLTNGAATLELVFWALLVAFAVGIPLGRLAARYHDRLPDVSIRTFAVLFYAAPVFFVGLLLKLLFSSQLGWLPASGRATFETRLELGRMENPSHILIIDAVRSGSFDYVVDVLRHAVLPAITLGLLTAGVFIRLIRINLLETVQADYVTAARARGVAERKVVSKHAFRNALIPVVTVMGMEIALMLGGAILTETTFEWDGIGYQLSQYLLARDFIAVQGIVTAIALVIALASFLIDVINALVDPRVRY
ncbi:MAG: ABC transporter permease [Bifidobacteriaceae bacterium]|jgi:peptide/nickel transport system permease protein|nr:ABC transporter permease [Bifidobacteriaceae bacterium]